MGFLFKTKNPFKSNLSGKEIISAGNLPERKEQGEEEEETQGGNQTREHTKSNNSFSKL